MNSATNPSSVTLHVRMCLLNVSTQGSLRVLYIDEKANSCYTIDLNVNTTSVQRRSLSLFLSQLAEGAYQPLPAMDVLRVLSDTETAERDRRWNAMKDLLQDEPLVYHPTERKKKLAVVQQMLHVSRPTILQYLRQYWQDGMTPDALAPRYHERGDQHEPGHSNAGKKRGAKTQWADSEGKQLTEVDLLRMDSVIQKEYMKANKPTAAHAYEVLIASWYDACPPEEIPSYQQFQYRINTHYDPGKRMVAREGSIHTSKDLRSHPGRGDGGLTCAGQSFEIDASTADLYLLSRYNHMPCERPTIYFVRDGWSRTICGFTVYFGFPCEEGALMALYHAIAVDKVSFCASYGIHIQPQEWPCLHTPRSIRGDRGELIDKRFTDVAAALHITIENTVAYNGQNKPYVENFFHQTNIGVFHWEDGNVQQGIDHHGKKPAYFGANLYLSDLIKKIIHFILAENSKTLSSRKIRDESMRLLHVPNTPIGLWQYSLSSPFSALIPTNPDLAKMALFPRARAKLTPDGFECLQLKYTGELPAKEDWFTLIKLPKKRHPAWIHSFYEVLYDPGDVSKITLLEPSRQLRIELFLKPEYGTYSSLPLGEVQAELEGEKKHRHQCLQESKPNKYKHVKSSHQITTQAKMQKPDLSALSKAEVRRQKAQGRSLEHATRHMLPHQQMRKASQHTLQELKKSPFLNEVSE